MITKSGITVKGEPNKPQPVVMPADDPRTGCAEFEDPPVQDGFCIFPLADASITNIEIAGLTVEGFPGSGIIGFSTKGLNIHDNTVLNNGEYGIARFESSHTQIVGNTVVGSDDPEHPSEAGIYVGDSPNASTLVRRNTSTNNQFGFFLRDSSHGTVTENTATGNCIGILLVDTPDDPAMPPPSPVTHWKLGHNTADDNTKACPGDDEGGPTSGVGIAVVGATHVRVTANHAAGNTPSGPTDVSGGLLVASAETVFGAGADESFVRVDNNNLNDNAPSTDLTWDGVGKSVRFAHNHCVTSDPGGLCSP